MSDLKPLKLVALASKADESLIPPLEQVVIFTKTLGYICELKLRHLPEKPFKRLPCPTLDPENLDERIKSKGIDFLGRYEFKGSEITVTLCICRIIKFCTRHGFNREDITKIVLIHELAHFATHLGVSDIGAYWEGFCGATSEEKESFAQDATHLLLRVAGYGYLVHVFGAVSHLCPQKYNTWRQGWEGHLKNKVMLDTVLEVFQDKILNIRERISVISEIGLDTSSYDN
jgi:hypothetical protein